MSPTPVSLQKNAKETGRARAQPAKHKKPAKHNQTASQRNSKPTRSAHLRVEVSDVPAPIPDTGTYSPPQAVSFADPTTTSSTAQQTLDFAPISVNFFGTSTASSSFTSSTSSISASQASEGSTASANHLQLSTTVIVLLSVGSAFILLGSLIILKICSTPRRRVHPIPSNPILPADFEDDAVQPPGESSPIFGGKERFSARTATSNGIPEWTQYVRPVTLRPHEAPLSSSQDSIARLLPPTNHSREEVESTLEVPKNGFQPSSANRTTSRLSTMSMSVYPDSPVSQNIGLAFSAKAPFVIEQPPSFKPARLNASQPNVARMSQGDPYDGADISSPTFPRHSVSQPLPAVVISSSNSGGRSRIKSSNYTPGSSKRQIADKSTKNTLASQDPFQPVYQAPATEACRERNTRALTSALGLSSPALNDPMIDSPYSPQPTIYPDDSLSVVAVKPPKRSKKKPVPQHSFDRADRYTGSHLLGTDPIVDSGPALDASATLGSLMMMEFEAASREITKQLVSPSQRGNIGLQGSPGKRHDLPPRVPSPDTLPSLAQMALEYSSAEYDQYRSPTYSLYGLYQDRKSTASRPGI